MARVPVFVSVADAESGAALEGVLAAVVVRESEALAVLFQTEFGAEPASNPMVTNAEGMALAWAEGGRFRIDFSGGQIDAYSEYRDEGGGEEVPPPFIQLAPADTWVIDHGLGRRPVISVTDPDGRRGHHGETHPSLNQTVLTFGRPMAGRAELR